MYQLGIDISKYQEKVDWNKVRATEVKFVIIRAVVGTLEDRLFKEHWAGSKAAGLLRGVYHYYRDDQDPKAQAKKLFDVLKSTGDLGELPPALDIEEINNPKLTVSKIKTCFEEIERLFGRTPIAYTRATVWNPKIGKVSWASRYPLWVAHYTISGWKENHLQRTANETKPTLPSPWSNWDIWQITDRCPARDYGVSGTTLDLDFAEEATLKRLTGKSIPGSTGDTGGTPPDSDPGPAPKPAPVGDTFDTKSLPLVTPTLSVKVLAGGLNLRQTTSTGNGVPNGTPNGSLKKNEVRKVVEVYRYEDRIWARVGTAQWLVVEKRDGTKYAEFVN